MADTRETSVQQDAEYVHGEIAETTDEAAPSVSPRSRRPPLPHANSASTDSKYSSFSSSHRHERTGSTSRAPLSPPLPPASFNPVPDTHPLLLAATSRHGSNGNLTNLSCMSPQEAADSPAIISPLGDVPPPIGSGIGLLKMHDLLSLKSPPFPPTPSRGISATSSLSATSSNQGSPFHYAEFQNDVGSLQRRLSQERRRRSSAQSFPRPFERSGSISAEEMESRNQPRADTSDTSAGDINFAQEQPKVDQGSVIDKIASADAEQSGMDHLRGARQELQAVIEEVVGDVFAARAAWESTDKTIQVEASQAASSVSQGENAMEDEPTQLGFQDDIVREVIDTDSALASTPASPKISCATEPQKNPPVSFEDLVRHRRRSSSSASCQFPLVNTSRSGPASPTPYPGRSRVGSTADGFMDSLASRTKQAYANHPSPPATRDDHLLHDANRLTMMRRTFSGESRSASPDLPPSKVDAGNGRVIGQDMMFREPIAPESILRSSNGVVSGHAQDANETKPTEIGTPVHELDSAMLDLKLAKRTDSMETYRPRTSVDTLSAEKQYRSRSNSRSGFDKPSRNASPDSEQEHPHDTHLWDSVWPSAATRATHPAASGHVPCPNPISEMRNTLRPQLPMHSRTMSMGMGGITGSGPNSGHNPVNHAHMHPMPMIHSLSFPAANQQSPPPFTSHTSGVPLSFSAAMSQTSTPCPWPQHPSARRGSIASLGVWPLKRDVSSGGVGDKSETIGGQDDAATPERKQTIVEESIGGEDGKDGEVVAGSTREGEPNGARAIEVAEQVQDNTIG